LTRPCTMRNSVVLPQPLSPTSDTISFSPTANEMWRSTGRRASFSPGAPRTRNVFETSSTASLMRSGAGRASVIAASALAERAHGVAEEIVDRYGARDQALLDREIDDDLERPPVGLDAEAPGIEGRGAALRERRLLGLAEQAIDLAHHVGPRLRELLADHQHVIDGHAAVALRPLAVGGLGVGDER